MNFTPLGNRIVVKQNDAPEKIGNILLPENLQYKPLEGTVVAAGPGIRAENGTLIPMEVKVGDSVIFARNTGTEVKIGDAKYVIVPETDVIGIVGG
jgi:chaperonin GroES